MGSKFKFKSVVESLLRCAESHLVIGAHPHPPGLERGKQPRWADQTPVCSSPTTAMIHMGKMTHMRACVPCTLLPFQLLLPSSQQANREEEESIQQG